MRRGGPLGHAPGVQLHLDIDQDEDGRVHGQVAADQAEPVAFSGWLELLRLLEGAVAAPAVTDREPLDDGRDEQEER